MSSTIIDIAGTAVERGRQCGEALRAHLARAWECYLIRLAANPLRPSKGEVMKRSRHLARRVAELDPESAEFLSGQVEGSGFGLEVLLSLRTMLEVSLYWQQFPAMCSSAGLRLSNGTVVIGQTIDWYPDGEVVAVRERRADGRRRLSLYLEGNPFYHLTSDGLANCANSTPHLASSFDVDLPLSFYVDLALRQPRLADAVAVLRRFGRGTGYFLLADAGRTLGLETQGSDHEIFEGDPVLHTNHYLCPRFGDGDLGIKHLPDTAARLALLGSRFADRPESIAEMLDRLCDREDGEQTHLWLEADDAVPPFGFATLAAFVVSPARREMHLRLRSGQELTTSVLTVD